MNKKLSVFAIILIIVGLIGTIWSGINTMPYFMREISKAEQEAIKEETIYNESIEDTKKLTIYTTESNVTVKKNNENKIKVNKLGNVDYARYDVSNNDNNLSISEVESNKNYEFKILDFKELFNLGIKSLVSINNSGLIVYIPENVDLEVVTLYGNLNIDDNLSLNSILFKTSSGAISLPKKIKNIDKLQILSSSNIYLEVTELLGINSLDIECEYLNIYSNESYSFIENIEDYIPDNINITQYNGNEYEGTIHISSNIPISKNLSINSANNHVYLDLPIESYKFNFDAKTSDYIELNYDLLYENTVPEKIKQIKGLINKDLEKMEKEYNINVKCRHLEIQ